MPNSCQTYRGTDYNLTVALLAFALVFSPAILMLSIPFSSVSAAVALGVSTLCVALAWMSWSRSSTLTIASVVR